MVPRPETETLVEEALAWARSRPAPVTVADVGTGSGCIVVSLAVRLPDVRFLATDVSPAALAVAEENARRHGVAGRVRLLSGHLLQPLPGPVDLVVANLPYVPSGRLDSLQPEVRDYEPRGALDGGPDGTDLLRPAAPPGRSVPAARRCAHAGDRRRAGFDDGRELPAAHSPRRLSACFPT